MSRFEKNTNGSGRYWLAVFAIFAFTGIGSAQAPPPASLLAPQLIEIEQGQPAQQYLDGNDSFVPDAVPTPAPRKRFPHSAQFRAEPNADGFSFYESQVGSRFPLFPREGRQPLLLSPRFQASWFDGPAGVELPAVAYSFSLSGGIGRQLNERWNLRANVGLNFATDFENTSSDAVRYQSMVLAMYQCRDDLQLIFGAVYTGREDLPVLPAIGAIWLPTERVRVDLVMPRPRISHRLYTAADRAGWAYFAGQLGGGTWAFQRSDSVDDVLSYRSFGVSVGFESAPATAGFGPPRGSKWYVEAGYLFGRRIEYDSGLADVELSPGLAISAGFDF